MAATLGELLVFELGGGNAGPLQQAYDAPSADGVAEAGAFPAVRLQGLIGGSQIGYNLRLPSNLVLGAEADVSFGSFSGMTHVPPLAFGHYDANFDYFGTVRVRAGQTMGRFLPYVTGGAVWGHQRLQGTDSQTGYFDASNNFWTYTFGGGVEGRLNERLSAKLEYLWIGSPDTPLSSPGTTSIDQRSIGNLLRVGLNYRF